LKSDKFIETDSFISALISFKIELNINHNPSLFHTLLKQNSDFLIKYGEPIVLARQKDILKYLKKKRVFSISGYKGYAVLCQDLSATNDLGKALALKSLDDQMSNLGAVYHLSDDKTYKVSLRGYNKMEGICHKIAKDFKGGGHANAASFFLNRKIFEKFLDY
jgi:nanoRNase/pAp phosphatase (c-di-AMP/oligoRNAs hydrolase)